MKHWIRNRLVLAIAILLIGAMSMWVKNRGDKDVSPFRTAPVSRADVVATITATGTVEPEESIDIGAQVQGRIIDFGKDKTGKPVDNNSEVEEGMVLALIDPSVYQSQVDQAQAQSNNANAAVARAQADEAIDHAGNTRRADEQAVAQIGQPQRRVSFIFRPVQRPEHAPLRAADPELREVRVHDPPQQPERADDRTKRPVQPRLGNGRARPLQSAADLCWQFTCRWIS